MGILKITRRAAGRALAGAALALPRVAAAAKRLGWAQAGVEVNLERSYRADAQVLLLSVPILHRESVGGGRVLWREAPGDNGSTLRLIEFNGFSSPARAAGLNRLGFFREMCRIAQDSASEAIYFGLMTASPEESAEEARKALRSSSAEHTYTAIEGRIVRGEIETSIAHFQAPAALSGAQREQLTASAHQALASAEKTINGLELPQQGACSFLQALAWLLAHPDRDDARYIYSGRLYRLAVKRAPDVKAAAWMKQRRLIGADKAVVRVTGRLRREAGGKETDFRVWVEQGAERPIPLRIEYQPKSYLRLTFEVTEV